MIPNASVYPTRCTPALGNGTALRPAPNTSAGAPCRFERLESRLLLDAVPVGPEVLVVSGEQPLCLNPSVAMDADGDFLVTWGAYFNEANIWGRLFDGTGMAQGPASELVGGGAPRTRWGTDVAMDADGGFVVVWQEELPGQDLGLYFQRFEATGASVGPEVLVVSDAQPFCLNPSVAMDADGDFLVTWGAYNLHPDIWGRLFDGTGMAQGPASELVGGGAPRTRWGTDVAMDADGDFVVVWQEELPGSYDMHLYAQRFRATGASTGPEVLVASSSGPAVLCLNPSVAMDADGDFLVTWGSYNELDGVWGRLFGRTGVAHGAAFELVEGGGPRTTWGNAVAMDADGDFVVVWQEELPGSHDLGLYFQRFQQPIMWTGGACDHWENGDNWSTGAPPDMTDTAVFDESAPRQPGLYWNEAITGLDFRTAGWTLSCNSHTLTVGEGGVTFASGGAPTSTIDLGTGNLVFDYTGASPLPEVAAYIASGCNGGAWDGLGITSSAAAADPRGVTAVGVIDNGDTETGIGGLTEFGGVPVDETSVLAACTWWGDINLDGVVDSNDYDRIDTNYVLWIKEGRVPDGGWRWAVGDLDYDHMIDSNDYDLIDNAFLLQNEPAAAGGAASVAGPDPLPLVASSPKASDLTDWPEAALVAGSAERQPVPQLADVLPALATVSAASDAAPFDGFAAALAAESANSAVLTAWPPAALRPVAEADRAATGDLLDPLALPALDIRL